ncbi:hypothetical protein IVB45_02170 [Bradyrhizobium sp. 4]|uniref:hypothetical protein n=1 Tax=Bradyrhizobium sp. 4 TaxID=2782678 RepID=UPI001FFE98E2|nr:hypothetical protein [Bradyrhizobium sp. 4]UPJ35840.1 hypothetical protein IVB45_02170 [Bradyrhizobium sp. 4]
MADIRLDGYLQLGDVVDLDCISAHNKNNLRAVEGKRLMLDYDHTAEMLDRHQKIIRARNKAAEFVILEGNHEFRLERYIDANPALEGMVEVPTALEFGRRKIRWVPSWSTGKMFTIGKANFIHGRYGGEHHAKKHVSKYGCNIFYGHIHDVQTYSAEMLGQENTMVGQSLGCLCLPQKYMRGAPDKWQQAFAIFEFLPDGHFTYNVIRIFKHRFIYNGKVYEG